MRDTERGRDIGRGRNRLPDTGLDPRILGSSPAIGFPAGSLLLPLPVSLPLSVSLMNK